MADNVNYNVKYRISPQIVPVFNMKVLGYKYQFNSLSFDPIGACTHDGPHSMLEHTMNPDLGSNLRWATLES
jgi:hypothetical protein